MNNQQLQGRLQYLRDNPRMLAGTVAVTGLVGGVVWALSKRGKKDRLEEALLHGDLDTLVREAARQGYEAGRAAGQTVAQDVEKSSNGIVMGMSPTELVTFFTIVLGLARQVQDFIREQQANA